MTSSDPVHIRQVRIAGSAASIEGNPIDPYFQNAEVAAEGMEALTSLASRHVPANGSILDIGANIGLTTIALARARPDGEIIAFEPSPVNVHFLRHNLAANNVTNVTVIQAALSDQEGEAAFHESTFGAGSHVVPDEHLGGSTWATVRVPMITLDTVIQRLRGRPVAFAKIDAEGHEPNILAGARGLLEGDAPLLYMEFNSWCLNAFGGHSPATFARALWKAFRVSQTSPAGILSEVEFGPIEFLHRNLTQHGCIDDLVLQFRNGTEFPSLREMSWPGHAASLVADLQRGIAAIERERDAVAAELSRTILERDVAAATSAKWFEAVIAVTADHNPLARALHGQHSWWRNFKRRRPSPMALADRARDARQWELAVRYYRDALDLESDKPGIWVQCGHALKESGKVSEAEVAYRKALELDGESADALACLGHALALQGKAGEAAAAYRQALALAPAPALRRGLLEELKKDPAAAPD